MSLKTSPVTERDLESGYPEAEEGELEEVETDADDIVYDALPYDEVIMQGGDEALDCIPD